MTVSLEEALAEALIPILQKKQWDAGMGFKHDASGTPISVGYSHGPGGLLTFPGVDPVMFHTTMGNMSMLGQIPTRGSPYTDPTYYTLTGVQGDTGAEKNDVCDDAPTAGLLKACLTTAPFGRYERSTGELELNRLGQRNDRADPMDLSLVGSPIHGSGIFASGAQNPDVPGDAFVNELSRKLWERNVSFHRLLSQQLWVGDPANNSAGGGSKEITSFSQLVNTGYVDAETGVTCPSIDSYLTDHNFVRVDDDGDALVATLTDAWYQVRDRALRTGVMPVRWVLAMRPQLFYEITAVWPCSYLSYRCNLTGQNRNNIDAQDATSMRDAMRAGQYLLIDGVQVPVVLDDGISELTDEDSASVPAGCFATDIYLIPMSVVGGQSVTFLEYFEYNNPSLTDAFGNMVLGRVEGAFLSWPRQTNQCFVIQSKVEPRLVMRTPWLAARIQNVLYCPIQHTRDTFPADPYHVDGGRTGRTGPSYFALWQD